MLQLLYELASVKLKQTFAKYYEWFTSRPGISKHVLSGMLKLQHKILSDDISRVDILVHTLDYPGIGKMMKLSGSGVHFGIASKIYIASYVSAHACL